MRITAVCLFLIVRVVYPFDFGGEKYVKKGVLIDTFLILVIFSSCFD